MGIVSNGGAGDGGVLVDAPACVPAPYGLMSVAEVEDKEDGHWETGVEYDLPTCEDVFVITSCPPADLPEKDPDGGNVSTEYADPFTLVAGYRCATGGRPVEEAWKWAEDRLDRNEARALERTFWRGRDVADNPIRQSLQGAPVLLTGATLTQGLALLEDYASDTYPCSPIIHIPRYLAVIMGRDLLGADGDIMRVAGTGTRVVVGGGYTPRFGPDGTLADADEAWLYVTGSIKILRGPKFFTPDRGDNNGAINRDTNEIVVFAERTYAIEQDCIVGAIRVTI